MENISLNVQISDVINYAVWQNRRRVIQEITIANKTGDSLEHVDLKITATPQICLDFEKHIDRIGNNVNFAMRELDILLNAEYLSGITEKQNAILHISLEKNGEVLTEHTRAVTALCYDEWQGSNYCPELLASFIQPNHPEVTKLITRAADFLEKWTGNPSLDAYQSQDSNRVLSMAAAIYAAIQELNIVYALPAASFEQVGQRVRLSDAIVQQKLGTCLDLTLLYASCLEAMGLNPILVLKKGHIFPGLWLEDKNFPEEIQEDTTLITKRLADGVNEIAVVEATLLTAGKENSFDQARATAEQELNGEDAVEYIVDVRRARLSKVVPLPSRVLKDDGTWELSRKERTEEELTDAPDAVEQLDVNASMENVTMDKKTQWERKLLDVSLRNTLINLRLSKKMLPIWAPSLDYLEDSLAEGEDYVVRSKPGEWKTEGENYDFENIHVPADYEDLILNDFNNNIIRSPYTESELESALKELYRTSRSSLEETGANTLFLALGVMRWYESDQSQKARYAPLILLPVDLIRRSVRQGYVLRLRDDDPQMNVTILEKIKQDFDIQIDGLDPLPTDEHGVDVRKVFTILRKALMNQTRWDILESVCLGIFSFNQYVMWNDIRNRSEDLKKNKVVKSLMDGQLAWDAVAMDMGDQVSEDDVFLPIPADASQLFAIREANAGNSFVLHGPPGTGKSQTITALIANALAQGKTVLFVAEKMAALEVVQKRLNAIGLGPFCLELHSNKARKRAVLDQLQQTINVKAGLSDEMYASKAQQIAGIRKELDAYATELHQKRECGYDVYELINIYEENKEADDLKPLDAGTLAFLNRESLLSHDILAQRLVAAAKELGHPCGHPLVRVGQTQYSQQIRQNIDAALREYLEAVTAIELPATKLSDALRQTSENMWQTAPVSESDYQQLASDADSILYWSAMPEEWAGQEDISTYFTKMQEMIAHFDKAASYREQLSRNWTDGFFAMDADRLKTEYEENEKQWFVAKLFGSSRIMKQLTAFRKNTLTKEQILPELQTLKLMQQEESTAQEMFTSYGGGLSDNNLPENVDWKAVLAKIADAKKNMAVPSLRRLSHENPSLLQTATIYKNVMDALAPKQEALYTLLNIRDAVDVPENVISNNIDKVETVSVTEKNSWISKEKQMITAIKLHKDKLKEWITWNLIADEARREGLSSLVEAYENGLEHDKVIPSYKKAIAVGLLTQEIDAHPVLGTFSGAVFNEKISQLKRLDEEVRELTKQEIYCRLAANVPDFTKESAKSSEVGILQRAIRSGGRGVSIRNLFDQLPNLLPKLCPCMLMSPISVAQYLVTSREQFDLVVFDEASQLPTCKAVGALARGKEAVIVGDPKQMPPTSFFVSNNVDEDNMDLEDLDSILDDCLALNMPQTYLLWHYRSRHESLIEFSNRQFYENKLYTFPSVNDRESRVNLVKVDGIFDKGKTRQNRVEAEAIVEEIRMRAHDPELSRNSVGVVTFNINQQNLIDDLLMDACKDDLELESWINREEEPLFIKNLENVQGDERDVILFSIGFGPDKDGKVGMNFGPLNRDGGWRRLNVAVSRARMEMKVFASMTHESINLSRSSSQGVAALKAFLKFAEDHTLDEDEATAATTDNTSTLSGVSDTVCRILGEHGYGTQQMVGDSQFRIDIGVIDPDDEDNYLLGILLDGPQYGSAKTTRDREIAQISVLEGLGWNITRLWTMDWWDNPLKETDRILNKIQELLEARKAAEEAANVEEAVTGEVPEAAEMGEYTEKSDDTQENQAQITSDNTGIAVESDTGANSIGEIPVDRNLSELDQVDKSDNLNEPDNLYKVTTLSNLPLTSDQFVSVESNTKIRQAIESVLQAEAPICESLLTKRVVQSFGITRVGPRIQDYIRKLYRGMSLTTTNNGDKIIYWNADQTPESYDIFRVNGKNEAKRDALEIPWEEAQNAILQVLRDQISLEEGDLIRESAKLMGFNRNTGNVALTFMSALRLASQYEKIEKDRNDRWILRQNEND